MKEHRVAILTDSMELSRSIYRYIKYLLSDLIEVEFYGTFKMGMSGQVFKSSELFILGSHRYYENDGLRSEGVYSAKKYIQAGKRVLIIAIISTCEDLDSHFVYNPCGKESLSEKILKVLSRDIPKIEEIESIENCFPSPYTPSHHHHHH